MITRSHVLLALALSACGGSGGGDDGDGSGRGGDSGLRDERADDEEALGGRYELTTTIDLTAAGVLPDFARSTVRSLSRFEEAPAAAMLELLERAGVPILSTVLALIPTSLQEYLAGWIDEWVVGSLYADVPITAEIAALADEIGSLFTALDVVTVLELDTPDGVGAAAATHALSGVTFSIGGAPYRVDASALADAPVGVEATAVHVLEQGPALEDGIVDLGDHTVSVPVGPLALGALEALVEQRYGVATLREALGAMVDCDGMGAWIGAQCWLGVCVGSEVEIAELCGAALDELAADVEQGIWAVELDALHFRSGTARMWDDEPRDGTIDRIDEGFFRLGLNLGAGERQTTAAFTGTRLDDEPLE